MTIKNSSSAVKLRVNCWGLCGSDLRGLISGRASPLTMGHEVAGVILNGPHQGRVASVFPIVPCFSCLVCKAGDWRHCPYRQTIGFELCGARAGILSLDSQLVFVHRHNTACEIAALTEHIACAVHMVNESRTNGLKGGSRVLVVGDGPMAFASAIVLRALSDCNIQIVAKYPARLNMAITMGFEAFLSSSSLAIDENCVLLVLACDIRETEICLTPSSRPILVAEVARQSTKVPTGDECEVTYVDSFAYTPDDFQSAVDLVDSRTLDFRYVQVCDEPPIGVDPGLAYKRLRGLPRDAIKYVFRRGKNDIPN